eukprot:2509792-Lingulodinium_polyedra.AAC.1
MSEGVDLPILYCEASELSNSDGWAKATRTNVAGSTRCHCPCPFTASLSTPGFTKRSSRRTACSEL